MNILILGSSASAISFADTFRKRNKEDNITIITSESIKPYFRPMLSHMIGTTDIPKNFFVKADDFYKENNINIMYNEEVMNINTESKKITTTKSAYTFDKLIIGMGSNNFIPPVKGADLANVCNLKFYKDLEDINEKLKTIDNITIIGGGLLGIEAAWSLAKSGKKVSILEFSNKLMARQLDIKSSEFLIKELEKSNIKVQTNASVIEILGDDKVKGYKLEDGSEFSTDMILYSVGVRPNLNIFKETSLVTNKGIVVDKNFLTSNEDIYALGDIAEYNSFVSGTWTAAMSSGKIAATHLLKEEYKSPINTEMPVVLKALDIDVASIGSIDESLGLIPEKSKSKYIRYFVKNGILIGAIIIGDKKQSIKLSSILNKEFIQ